MINRETFFAGLRAAPFGGRIAPAQAAGLTHLLDVWEGCYADAHPDRRFLAYCLATAFHETARAMRPIEEYGKGRGRAYGHPAGPWRLVYDGRGDVQLTWERNYVFAAKRLREAFGIGVDLDHDPTRAMDPDIAAHILYLGSIEGWFTGKRLSQYFNATTDDPLHARRIINGLDKAALIAAYHHAFTAAIRAMIAPKAA